MFKNTTKKKKLQIPVYHGFLTIIKCENWTKVNKQYKCRILNNWDGVFFKSKNEYVIAFKGAPKGSIIAHEVTHLVNQVFIDRLIKLDPENDEAQAYLTEFFFEEIELFLNRIEVINKGL